MQNSFLINQMNSSVDSKKPKNICVKNGVIEILIKNTELDNSMITTIIGYANYINQNFKSTIIPIRFILIDVVLTDKLAYVIFECVIETMMSVFHRKIEVYFTLKKMIITEGISSSPLLLLGNRKNKKLYEKNQEFIDKFNFDYYRNHFRRVVKYADYLKSDKLSKLYDDIAYFQKSFDINYDCLEDVSEVIVELIGNALEHSKSDCLVDFDIAPNYTTEDGDDVCGINIAILSFSNILLGDSIAKKMSDFHTNNLENTRYEYVKNAFNNHKNFFDDEYDTVDFYNISTFQHRISGSEEKINNGGIGLTKLVKSIEDNATKHTCYVLSGNRIIMFEPEYLEYNKEGWIGFNKDNNYLHSQPDPSVLQRSNFFMPGTAYNLNFVMKVNKDE